ncbi:MAG: acyltransferase family protein [Acutalibacteraceae bacterium]
MKKNKEKKIENQRQPGLDLIRCLALLFVLTFHSFLYNGYYHAGQVGLDMYLAGSFRWLSVSCIGLFLMLSGYLKSENTNIKSCYRALLSVILCYFLVAAITIPIRHFVFNEVHTFSAWLTMLFEFSAVKYGWYVEMYIGLVLIIPFINVALKHLSNKEMNYFAVAMLILTALSGATKWSVFPDYWRITYPITYYILGAIVRRCQPKVDTWLGLLGAVSVAAVLGGFTVLSTDGMLQDAVVWEFADIWIVLIVVCLFVALYRVKIHPIVSRVLKVMAGGCYGGYLLSHLLDAKVYSDLFPQFASPDKYFLMFICATIPIYIVCVLLGIVIQKLTNLMLPRKKNNNKQKISIKDAGLIKK